VLSAVNPSRKGVDTQMREVQVTAEHLMRRDVILAKARKKGLKERPISLLGYLLGVGKGTASECEGALKTSRRTIQRDLKLLVQRGLVRDVGTSPTAPAKYYQPLL